MPARTKRRVSKAGLQRENKRLEDALRSAVGFVQSVETMKWNKQTRVQQGAAYVGLWKGALAGEDMPRNVGFRWRGDR